MEDKPKLVPYLQFKNIFRTLALCFTITIFFGSIPGLFFNRLYNLDLIHHFVFLLGNAILVTLFVKFASDNHSVAADEHLIGSYLFDHLEYDVDQMQLGRSEVDDLSNEEFQKEVDAFIERQWRLLRQESHPTAVSA